MVRTSAAMVVVAFLLCACAGAGPAPTATPTEVALAPSPTAVGPTKVPTLTPTHTPTSTPTHAPQRTSTPAPTRVPPTPTPTPLPGFNGYRVSPIGQGTGAYICTYQNVCPEYIDGSDPICIENYMGEKGHYPDDYWEILTIPPHIQGWDICWDHQGEKVFAVQGGQILDVESEGTLEGNSTIGVHFFIVDKKPDGWYAAGYGHVNMYSMAENGIIGHDQIPEILAGRTVDGAWVREKQLLGVTGDDRLPYGMLHIGTGYCLYPTDPADLWRRGEWPDVCDCRPIEAGLWW